MRRAWAHKVGSRALQERRVLVYIGPAAKVAAKADVEQH